MAVDISLIMTVMRRTRKMVSRARDIEYDYGDVIELSEEFLKAMEELDSIVEEDEIFFNDDYGDVSEPSEEFLKAMEELDSIVEEDEIFFNDDYD